MSDFTADPDALDSQGYLHTRIAQFYRDVADKVSSQGSNVLKEFNRVNNQDYAGQYQMWLNTSNVDGLRQEATLHDNWAQYFHDLADKVRTAEKLISGEYLNPPLHHGNMRFE
jgi:hypothetical protein